jgi:hypothetical protein
MRPTAEDPWDIKDNFRLNHHPLRDLTITFDNNNEERFLVQYVDENTFNVFYRDEDDSLIPITLDAVVHMSEEKEN